MQKKVSDSALFFVKIDKNILAVDFQALNLLQAALFTQPTKELIIELKRKFGILYLTSIEIQQELKSVHSTLRKYLSAMMMSLIYQSRMLLTESFQTFLLNRQKLKIKKIQKLLMLLQRRNLRWRSWIMLLKRKLRLLNRIASDSLLKLHPRDFEYIRPFIVEAHRYDLLRFYLSNTDAKLAPFVVEVVNSHINMLTYSFHRYEELSKNDLDNSQLSNLDDWLEVTTSHIKAIKPENIEGVTTNSPISNSACLKQYLLKRLTIDLIAFRRLEKIDSKRLFSSQAKSDGNIIPSQQHIDNIQTHVEIKYLQNRKFEYQLLLNKLCSYFTMVIIENKGLLIHETEAILNFFNMILKIISKQKYPINFEEVEKKAISLIEKLTQVKDVDYSPLIDCLKEIYKPPLNLNTNKLSLESDRMHLESHDLTDKQI